jgi:hypothetical protein
VNNSNRAEVLLEVQGGLDLEFWQMQVHSSLARALQQPRQRLVGQLLLQGREARPLVGQNEDETPSLSLEKFGVRTICWNDARCVFNYLVGNLNQLGVEVVQIGVQELPALMNKLEFHFLSLCFKKITLRSLALFKRVPPRAAKVHGVDDYKVTLVIKVT